MPVQRQVAVAVELLNRYADLVASARATDDGTVWQALPWLLDQVRLPAVLREPSADPRGLRLLNLGLLALGQGDQATPNIVVEQRDTSWQGVDFDGAGLLSVWWDPIALVRSIPRHAGELGTDSGRMTS